MSPPPDTLSRKTVICILLTILIVALAYAGDQACIVPPMTGCQR